MSQGGFRVLGFRGRFFVTFIQLLLVTRQIVIVIILGTIVAIMKVVMVTIKIIMQNSLFGRCIDIDSSENMPILIRPSAHIEVYSFFS